LAHESIIMHLAEHERASPFKQPAALAAASAGDTSSGDTIYNSVAAILPVGQDRYYVPDLSRPVVCKANSAGERAMTRQQLMSACKKQFERGDDFEILISFLRVSGCSKIDSMAILIGSTGIDLSRAKELVHFSRVWEDKRLADEQFQQMALNAVEKR
jgi:hypothetical protein